MHREFTCRRLLNKPFSTSWYGRLIYDGVVLPVNPKGDIQHRRSPTIATNELTAELRETVRRCKREGRVIERLAQLDVEGGSRVGLHELPGYEFDEEKVRLPPTPEEQALVDKIERAPIRPYEAGFYWALRRRDTELSSAGTSKRVCWITGHLVLTTPFCCRPRRLY